MNFFRRWGAMKDLFVPKKKDAKCRVFAFVWMSTGAEAEKAIKGLHWTLMKEKQLLVQPSLFGITSLPNIDTQGRNGRNRHQAPPSASGLRYISLSKQLPDAKKQKLPSSMPRQNMFSWPEVIRWTSEKKEPLGESVKDNSDRRSLLIQLMMDQLAVARFQEKLSNSVILSSIRPLSSLELPKILEKAVWLVQKEFWFSWRQKRWSWSFWASLRP